LELEESIIGSLVLLLNLDQSRRSPFYDTLSELHAAHRLQARSQPINLAAAGTATRSSACESSFMWPTRS
jgi:hypothetical protein